MALPSLATLAQAPAPGAPAAASASTAAHRPPDTMAERVAACVACHGAEGRATTDGYYPRIAGKPAGYLFNQLVNFRDGRRDNATMRYLVSNLPDAYLREIAEHFSAQNPPYAPPQPAAASPAVLERGRRLATAGDPAKNLPACAACHGSALTGTAPAIPGLIGLPRDYLNAQFGAWSNKARRAQSPDCMAQIAGRLSADDLGAVTAFLAAQPVPAHAAPAASAIEKLPLDCGGVPMAGAASAAGGTGTQTGTQTGTLTGTQTGTGTAAGIAARTAAGGAAGAAPKEAR
jgi:cytochrome c553